MEKRSDDPENVRRSEKPDTSLSSCFATNILFKLTFKFELKLIVLSAEIKTFLWKKLTILIKATEKYNNRFKLVFKSYFVECLYN